MPRANTTTERTRPRAPKRRRRWITPSDVIFFLFALATYFHEFWQGDGEPTLLGLFAVFFFLGLIPAFRADGNNLNLGDVQGVMIRLLGGTPPGEEKEK